MNYFIRVYIEVDSNELAQRQALILLSKLNNFSESKLFKIKEYWKIDGYFEVSIDIQSELNLDELSCRLASKWENCGASYVWNYEQESFFALSKARWASLESIE